MMDQVKKWQRAFPKTALFLTVMIAAVCGYLLTGFALALPGADVTEIAWWRQGAAGFCGVLTFVMQLFMFVRE